MPKLLIVKNLIFMIHTRDHGHPHVTVYLGNPTSHEAMAKIRLDQVEVIESKGFNRSSVKFLIETTEEYHQEWLEVWNEIHKR